jgi:hypothetical protein
VEHARRLNWQGRDYGSGGRVLVCGWFEIQVLESSNTLRRIVMSEREREINVRVVNRRKSERYRSIINRVPLPF